MDENYNPEIPTSAPDEQEEQELSHTDKMTGIFTEPSKTFEKVAKFPPRTKDWFIPVMLMVVIAILANFFMMSNPAIKQEAMDKQIKTVEKSFDDAVAKGQMTQEQADEQMENVRNRMEGGTGAAMMAIQAVSTIVILFIVFFIVSLIYLLVGKSVLKGEGAYASAMVANALPYYISIITIIITTIISFLMNKLVVGLSIASIMGMDKSTYTGFLLGKVDPLTIWALYVTGVGIAKMFNSQDVKKSLITVYSIWIVWGLITFFIAKAVPFLSFLNM
ncbi:MAG: YIP1 family protein [Ignavibacteriales bacterium]|nr:YIP1 family protein [Ignavibacteriales bacterium]